MNRRDAVMLANLALLMLEYKVYLYSRPNLWLTLSFEQWLDQKCAKEEMPAKADTIDYEARKEV